MGHQRMGTDILNGLPGKTDERMLSTDGGGFIRASVKKSVEDTVYT
jgi:hypothetical protein